DDIGAVDIGEYQEKVGEIITDLADKVDAEFVDGKLVDKANKDDVYTIEQLDDMYDNVVTKTVYETDKEGIITDLESHETRISQSERDIKSKVSDTQYQQDKESLETSISDNQSSIEQNARKIESKVSDEQYQTDKEGILNNIESNTSSIEQNAKKIRSKVDETYVQGELGKIEIGGRNLYPFSSFEKFKEGEEPSGSSSYLDICEVSAEKSYTGDKALKIKAQDGKAGYKRLTPYGESEETWLYLEKGEN